jgi:hypothetical protein
MITGGIFNWKLWIYMQNHRILVLQSLKSGRFGASKSDSTYHFFRNACTKSGSLRFSQFSGCWLILSVYILMSFDFPFVRFGVQCQRHLRHTVIKKYLWHFCWLPYLYTFSLWKSIVYYRLCRDGIYFDKFLIEFDTALTTSLPILFQYCYNYCYSDSRNLWAVMKAGGLAL